MNRDKDRISKILHLLAAAVSVILFSSASICTVLASPLPGNHPPFGASPPLQRFAARGDFGTGDLLIASEKMKDRRFARTVILLTHSDHRGTSGVIINRPTGAKLSHVLPHFKGIQNAQEDVFFGGPVGFNRKSMLIRSPREPEESFKIFEDVYITGSLGVMEKIIGDRKPDEDFRLFSGYAGWAPRQLEVEIARGDWIIVGGDRKIVFDDSPETIWKKLLLLNRGSMKI
jgi:putative transcriptional regulator